MVGLSVILENYRPQILSKGAIIKPSSPSSLSNFSPVCGFLEYCSLCNHKLMPGKDIFMYNVECRYRQIFKDEEERCEKRGSSTCSVAAATSSPSSSSSSSRRVTKGRTRSRANAFAH